VSVGSSIQRLDDLEAFAELDTLGVLGVVEDLAAQVREGWQLGRTVSELPSGEGIETVLVLGVGGSGVSGDIVRAILEDRLALPVQVLKSYGAVPAWVGRNTLVFAVSYSGGTDETLAALEEVHQRGGRAVAVSSGGRLGEMAAEFGIAHVVVPGGLQPRASLGYLVTPILSVLEEIGLVPPLEDDIRESIAVLEELRARCERSVASTENPAKRLAASIQNRIPVVYGGHGLASVAAYRFKCDINEYAKAPAFWNELPEMNHNEIEGWSGLAKIAGEPFVAVMLRDAGEDPRVSKRFEVTERMVRGSVAETVEVWSHGDSSLARLFSLVYVTQMAAIYLGLAYGVDPGPVEVLERLKRELRDGE
jgi:glucose/mannose-6-phosphate isomerase